MKTIVLVGVPGAGKSSILQEVVRQMPHIKVVNYGDKMLQEATSEGITRDELRKMPFKEQQQIGIKAARKIRELDSDEVVIIDTHALVRTKTGYCPGLPLEVLQLLSPIAYAMVECLPHLILERREKDPQRVRDDETADELLKHQELSRSFLTACCMQTGSLLCCINNDHPSIDLNVLPLIRLIQSL